MRLIAILALLISVQSVVAAETATQRPRDRYQKPIAVDADMTKKIIEAIRHYKVVLEAGDYRRFYRECFHRAAKERQTEEAFAKQIEPVAPKLVQFFSDILTAYEKGLHQKEDFQIGRMPYPIVKESLMIQFADRIDDVGAKRWPDGAPLRIQMAPDGDTLSFYDID